jgi:hypothetical protein
MNKRILKLFNEAGFHQPEMERQGLEDKFEKFAELIVTECCQKLENDGMVEVAMELKWHFGMDTVEKEIRNA